VISSPAGAAIFVGVTTVGFGVGLVVEPLLPLGVSVPLVQARSSSAEIESKSLFIPYVLKKTALASGLSYR
jgi:hypothetical protein